MVRGYFWPITGNFREHLFLLAALCCAFYVGTTWLAAETSDVPYVLKLASAVKNVCKQHHQLELSWDGPVYTAATFPANILSLCESLVQTGLERESNNNRNKIRASKNREGRVRRSCFSHATVSLISKYCLPQFLVSIPVVFISIKKWHHQLLFLLLLLLLLPSYLSSSNKWDQVVTITIVAVQMCCKSHILRTVSRFPSKCDANF